MHVRRVKSAKDVECLRVLRNECRTFMTGDKKSISKKKQAAWWAEAPRRAWLFGDSAFVYLRWEDHRNWITLGVTEGDRGAGIGTMLYHTFKPCWARIARENESSIRAATRAGYIRVSQDDDVVVMKG